MEPTHTHFRKHFFSYILIIAILANVGFSYYRFIIMHDYLVGYEGTCDPKTEKCFTGCTDDACTESYYYSQMRKYEPDLFAECGVDITDCEEASVCLSNDRDCSITYCDEKTKTEDEECISGIKNSDAENDKSSVSSLGEDKILQDNTSDNDK